VAFLILLAAAAPTQIVSRHFIAPRSMTPNAMQKLPPDKGKTLLARAFIENLFPL